MSMDKVSPINWTPWQHQDSFIGAHKSRVVCVHVLYTSICIYLRQNHNKSKLPMGHIQHRFDKNGRNTLPLNQAATTSWVVLVFNHEAIRLEECVHRIMVWICDDAFQGERQWGSMEKVSLRKKQSTPYLYICITLNVCWLDLVMKNILFKVLRAKVTLGIMATPLLPPL
jgi:hypothetical protein